MRADEIAIETAKIGKVTAVVAVMSIVSKKRCKLPSANRRSEKLSCQKAESACILEGNTCRSRSLSQKLRKSRIPKKLVPEMNCTNLKLNSKRHAQIVPKCLIQALALD
jgi:hypothetical protein